jgi:hypothetical protein
MPRTRAHELSTATFVESTQLADALGMAIVSTEPKPWTAAVQDPF